MFKKLRDRVTNAVSGAPANSNDPVRQLQIMVRPQTVSVEQARAALQACGGNVDMAAERLLLSGVGANQDAVSGNDDDLQRALQASLQVSSPAASPPPEDDDLRRAMQASLETQEPRVRSAASVRAGQAALSRFENNPATFKKAPAKKKAAAKSKPSPHSSPTPSPVITPPSSGNGVTALPSAVNQLKKHHPNVVVPKTVDQGAQDEKILRLADRLASHAPAVDTLLRALNAVRSNPDNKKFHTIDASTPGFQRSLSPVPPQLLRDWLAVVHYHSVDGVGSLYHLSFVDHATLYLAISALERVQKESVTYRTSKRQWKFLKTFQTIAGKHTLLKTNAEGENTVGTGAWITVTIGEEKKTSESSDSSKETTIGSTVRRRFDGDDIVMDVLKWISSGSEEVMNALTTDDGPWCVWDKNASTAVDCTDPKIQQSTLQSVEWWPSGRLVLTMREIAADSKM